MKENGKLDVYEKYIKNPDKKQRRPSKYGARVNVKQLLDNKNFVKNEEVNIYGKKLIVNVAAKIVQIRSWDKPILMVVTRDVHKNPIILFSTDITLSPVRIIELYSLRWKIEIAFRDLKEMGKMSDYRVRNNEGMTKHITLCFVAHSLLRLLQYQKIQFNVKPAYRPWYKKAKLSMGMIRMIVQRECMLQLVFMLLGRLNITYEKVIVANEFNELLNLGNEDQYEQILQENG